MARRRKYLARGKQGGEEASMQDLREGREQAGLERMRQFRQKRKSAVVPIRVGAAAPPDVRKAVAWQLVRKAVDRSLAACVGGLFKRGAPGKEQTLS